MHEPASQLAGFNASFWGSLSESDQQLIMAVAQAENDNIMSEYNAKNGAALERLINDQGVTVREFNSEVYEAFGRGSAEVYAEVVEILRLHAASTNQCWLPGRLLVNTSSSTMWNTLKRNAVLGGY